MLDDGDRQELEWPMGKLGADEVKLGRQRKP